MNQLKGVFQTTKKDGTVYYRSSITYRSKHISLGSFDTAKSCHEAYLEAEKILKDFSQTIERYDIHTLSFEKAVCLLNFRDNKLYSPNPIYMHKNFFRYYLERDEFLTFDTDDLFYYAKHKIMRRGGHLFVADYGMQISILSRYGIQSYAVLGRDYVFKNGDTSDFRYANIQILNPYHGVLLINAQGKTKYRTVIHINGNIIVGTYQQITHAAIAYNKAIDILKSKGLQKNYPINYIEGLSPSSYADIYSQIKISDKICNYSEPCKKL